MLKLPPTIHCHQRARPCYGRERGDPLPLGAPLAGVRGHRLRLTRIGGRTYVFRGDWDAFVNTLNKRPPRNLRPRHARAAGRKADRRRTRCGRILAIQPSNKRTHRRLAVQTDATMG